MNKDRLKDIQNYEQLVEEVKKEKVLATTISNMKEIAREVSPGSFAFNQTIKKLRADILRGQRVAFFIKGKPVVGFLNRDTQEIEIKPLDVGEDHE